MPASTSDLFKWLTEEMEFLPCKVNGAVRGPINSEDLNYLFQGHGEDIWNHVIKHVRSAKKVDSIRKNILLSRVKSQQKMPEIQKNDYAGNLLNELHESCSIRSKLLVLKDKNKETEELVKQLANDLKVAACKVQYLSNAADDMERRNCLLEMANEMADIKIDTVLSSKELFKMERDGKESSVSDVSCVMNSRDGTIVPVGKILDVDMIPKINNNCKVFLDRCGSMASELINEIVLNVIKNKRFSSSTLSGNAVDVTCSNYFSFVGCNRGDDSLNNHKKDNDLRTFISENMMRFSPEELFEALIQRTSEGITKMAGLRIPSSRNFFSKFSVLGSEENSMKKLNDMLSEEKTNLNYIISQDFVVTAHEKVVTTRSRNAFKILMSEVECNLKEIFTIDLGMFEKAYELVALQAEEARISGMISYLENSIRRMQMDMPNKKSVDHQSMKLVDQLKEIKREKVHQSETKEVLQRIRQEIQPLIFSNHNDVKIFLDKIKADFESETEALEVYNGLLSKEIKAFVHFPLEYLNRTTISSGRMVPDSQLLLSGFNFNNLKMNELELKEAFGQWVKCTMGLAPFSSTDVIFLAVIRMKESLKQLRAAKPDRFFINDNILQGKFGKIPEQLAEIDADINNWEQLTRYLDEMNKEYISMISNNLKETEYIYQVWSEGVINKYVPESVHLDGKDFVELYGEMQAILKRK